MVIYLVAMVLVLGVAGAVLQHTAEQARKRDDDR
jgi:archaellin